MEAGTDQNWISIFLCREEVVYPDPRKCWAVVSSDPKQGSQKGIE